MNPAIKFEPCFILAPIGMKWQKLLTGGWKDCDPPIARSQQEYDNLLHEARHNDYIYIHSYHCSNNGLLWRLVSIR